MKEDRVFGLFLQYRHCVPLVLGSEWQKKLADVYMAVVVDFVEHPQVDLLSSVFKTCPLQVFEHRGNRA